MHIADIAMGRAVPTVWILSRSCPVSYSALVLYQAGSWCYRVGNMASETFTYSTINLDEPEPLANKQSTILGVVISFMVLSWLCAASRLYVRLRVVRDAGWDDLCVVLYLLTTTGGSIALCLGTRYGLGKHFITLATSDMHTWAQTFYVANAAYCSSTAFIKLALMFQYLRVYPKGSLTHRISLYTLIFTAIWGAVYSFIAWFPCFPVYHVWIQDPDALCYGYGSLNSGEFVATYESHTAINMVLDIIVLAIPLPLLFKESTDFAQRLRIAGLVSMGTVVIAIAIWRLQTIIEHQAATWPTRDPTWYGPITMLLAVLEVDAAAVCASVPIFWPVFTQRLGDIFVTQEIEIRRETRYMIDDEESRFPAQAHSRSTSDAELKQTMSGTTKTDASDTYGMRSMDPRRATTKESPRVAAMARSDSKMSGGHWSLDSR